MKNLLLSLLLLIGFFESAYTQTIYLEKDFASGTGPATELIEAVTYLVNNSTSSIDFVWERIEYNMPSEWSAPFCDKNNCYAPFTTTAGFNLVTGESGLLKPIFTPNSVEGIGTMKIRIYSVTAGFAFDDTVTFQATTDGLVGVNDIAEASSISIYPNITRSTFSITSSSIVPTYYSIISSDGNVVSSLKPLSWQSEKSEIDVSLLQAGLYYVVLYSREQSALISKPIIKL